MNELDDANNEWHHLIHMGQHFVWDSNRRTIAYVPHELEDSEAAKVARLMASAPQLQQRLVDLVLACEALEAPSEALQKALRQAKDTVLSSGQFVHRWALEMTPPEAMDPSEDDTGG